MHPTFDSTFKIHYWTKCWMKSHVEKFEELRKNVKHFHPAWLHKCIQYWNRHKQWRQSHKKCWMKSLVLIKLHPTSWYPTFFLKSWNFMMCANESNISSNKNVGCVCAGLNKTKQENWNPFIEINFRNLKKYTEGLTQQKLHLQGWKIWKNEIFG